MRKRSLGIALCLLFLYPILFQFQTSFAAEKASIQQILSNPDQFDGKEVNIIGTASNIRSKTSKKGNDYTSFTLNDQSGKGMNIFSWGRPRVGEGQKVMVTGVFSKVKRVGRYTFYNEVEAKEVR